jgi:hypothetical protein
VLDTGGAPDIVYLQIGEEDGIWRTLRALRNRLKCGSERTPEKTRLSHVASLEETRIFRWERPGRNARWKDGHRSGTFLVVGLAVEGIA